VGNIKKQTRQKANANYRGLSFKHPMMTREENVINIWCIDNNVRIGPVPTKQGPFPDEWRIEIRLGAYKRGEKNHLSPSIYTYENVHQEVRRMQKHYYDKHKE